MERQYRYLGYFLLLMLPLIAVAFHQSYGSKFPNFEPGYDIFIHIHAALASVWVALLIIQPFLITNKKLDWHRTLGKLSYFIFPLLILSFVPGMIKIAHSGDYKNLWFPGGDCLLLILFYSLSIFYRKSTGRHMRYMISLTLVLLGPTIGRIGPHILGMGEVGAQTLQYGIIFSILAGLIMYDRSNKKDSQPYVIAIGGFTIHAIVFFLLFL